MSWGPLLPNLRGLVYGAGDAKGSVTAKPEQCSWPEDCGKGSIYHTRSGMRSI